MRAVPFPGRARYFAGVIPPDAELLANPPRALNAVAIS